MDSTIFMKLFILFLPFLYPIRSRSGLLAEPVLGLNPPNYSTPNTVPSFPVQSDTQKCHLDLSDELFGGVTEACGRDLDRSRCCPVLAAWLYAAHASSALQIQSAKPPPNSDSNSDSDSDSDLLPMMPDSDSQKCVNTLEDSLQKRNIKLPQANATCDTVLCFCGIRLHKIASLSCPAAFNLSGGGHRNATPTGNVKNLEKNCRNSSYAGCTKCLGALEKLKGGDKNGTSLDDGSSRASKMFNRDCQLMGLTWLLARNKTAYIPTVSAVLRAIMYSAHPPHHSRCSPDQENMPLAVDSLQFDNNNSSSPPSILLLSLSSYLALFISIIVMLFLA